MCRATLASNGEIGEPCGVPASIADTIPPSNTPALSQPLSSFNIRRSHTRNLNIDWAQLDPMVSAGIAELERAGVQAPPEVALAGAQYWNEEHIDEVVANKHVQVLIPPDSGSRETPRPGWSGGRYTWMRYVRAWTDAAAAERRDLRERIAVTFEPPSATSEAEAIDPVHADVAG